MKPVYFSIGLNAASREIVILGVNTDSAESALIDANLRATELWGTANRSTTVLSFTESPQRGRQHLREWLAENDILGAEATDTINELASAIVELLDGNKRRMIPCSPR